MVYNVYFSPTGGTKRVGEMITAAMTDEVVNIDLLKKDRTTCTLTAEDVCVLSAPAFGGRVPKAAIDSLQAIRANGAKAVLVAVFGNRAIDDTLAELQDVAASVGFDVIAAVEAVAEHSLVRKYGAGRPNEQDRAELACFAKCIAEKLQNGDNTPPTIPGNRPYKEFHPSAMTLVVEDTCINCKRCARECPVDAIPMENVKTVDSDKCFSCMHCVAVCPVNARHNAPTVTAALEERLRDRCAEVKPNKLYI